MKHVEDGESPFMQEELMGSLVTSSVIYWSTCILPRTCFDIIVASRYLIMLSAASQGPLRGETRRSEGCQSNGLI